MTIPVTVSTENLSFSVGTANSAVTIPVSVSADKALRPAVSDDTVRFPVTVTGIDTVVPVKCTSSIGSADYPEYHGEYEFTPSSQTQIVDVSNTILHHDIVINPIPQNYGLITWNGSVLTVS